MLNLTTWQRHAWTPAVEAAGIAKPARIYDLRSAFASNALAAGGTLFELARIMGTSVLMIERSYARIQPGFLCELVEDAIDEFLHTGDFHCRLSFRALVGHGPLALRPRGLIRMPSAHARSRGNAPSGIRTRATTLKGWRPGPLVDGGGRARIPAAGATIGGRAGG